MQLAGAQAGVAASGVTHSRHDHRSVAACSRSPQASTPVPRCRQRPDARAVGGDPRGVGRVRVLRRAGCGAPEGLRASVVARRAVHGRERRARVPLVQREQEQRRGHRMAAPQTPRRTPLSAALGRDRGGAANRTLGIRGVHRRLIDQRPRFRESEHRRDAERSEVPRKEERAERDAGTASARDQHHEGDDTAEQEREQRRGDRNDETR
jgi:hypothetical protein